MFVGDWTRSGNDTLGIHPGSTCHLLNTFREGAADVTSTHGRTNDELFIGDCNGNGQDTPAVRRGRTLDVTNRLRGGDADVVFIHAHDPTSTVGGHGWVASRFVAVEDAVGPSGPGHVLPVFALLM